MLCIRTQTPSGMCIHEYSSVHHSNWLMTPPLQVLLLKTFLSSLEYTLSISSKANLLLPLHFYTLPLIYKRCSVLRCSNDIAFKIGHKHNIPKVNSSLHRVVLTSGNRKTLSKNGWHVDVRKNKAHIATSSAKTSPVNLNTHQRGIYGVRELGDDRKRLSFPSAQDKSWKEQENLPASVPLTPDELPWPKS